MQQIVAEQPYDQRLLEEVLSTELLTLLKDQNPGDFVNTVIALSAHQKMKITSEIGRLPKKVRRWVRMVIGNTFDAALEGKQSSDKDLIVLIRMIESIEKTWFDEEFKIEDKLLSLAETHCNPEMMMASLDALCGLQKNGTQFNPKLFSILMDLTKLHEQSTESDKHRFSNLPREERLLLKLFGRLRLNKLDPSKYKLDDDLQLTMRLLKSQPHHWLLPILDGFICEQLGPVYRQILNAGIEHEPSPHLTTIGEHVHPTLTNSVSMSIAARNEPSYFKTVRYAPESLSETSTTLYLKFETKLSEYYLREDPTPEINTAKSQAQTPESTKLSFDKLVEYFIQLTHAFHKNFAVVSGHESKLLNLQEKLSLLNAVLQLASTTIEVCGLDDLTKILAERNVFEMALAIVDEVLQTDRTNTIAWKTFASIVRLYTKVTEVGNGNFNLEAIAASKFPQLLLRIITHEGVSLTPAALSQAFHLLSRSMEPLLKKAKRELNMPAYSVTEALLESYFNLGKNESAIDVVILSTKSSPDFKALLDGFFVKKLNEFRPQLENIVHTLMSRKTRCKQVNQMKFLIRLLERNTTRLTSELSVKFFSCLAWFASELSSKKLAIDLEEVMKKLDLPVRAGLYQQQLDTVTKLLHKNVFEGLSLPCIFSDLSNLPTTVQSDICHLFNGLATIVLMNTVGQGDYSESGFDKLMEIFLLFNKAKAMIHDQFLEELREEKTLRCIELQLLNLASDEFTFTSDIFAVAYKCLTNCLEVMLFERKSGTRKLTLEEQLILTRSFKAVFRILKGETSQHKMCVFLDDLSNFFGCRRISLHVNFYFEYRKEIFETIAHLNSLDRTSGKVSEDLSLSSIGDYLICFEESAPQSFAKKIETKLVFNIKKFMELFIVRPINPYLPLIFEGGLYFGEDAGKLALGMYIDQLKWLMQTLNLGNLRIHTEFIRKYLTSNFLEKMINSSDFDLTDSQDSQVLQRLIAVVVNEGVKPEIALMAVFSTKASSPQHIHEWLANHPNEVAEAKKCLAAHGQDSTRLNFLRTLIVANPKDIFNLIQPILKILVKKLQPYLTSEHSQLVSKLLFDIKCFIEKEKELQMRDQAESGKSVTNKSFAPSLKDLRAFKMHQQTVIVREDRIIFEPVPPKNKTSLHLEQDPAGLIPNILRLLEQPALSVRQIIFECYEKSVRHINREESKRVEAALQQKKDRFIPCSPVLMLGRALSATTKVVVSYSEKQTVTSQLTMWHLTTQFGKGWIKGTYLYEDDEKYSFDTISKDSGKLESFTVYFREDMAMKYNTSPDDIIIQEIVRGSIYVRFYYREGVPDGVNPMSKSGKKHLQGRTVKEQVLFSQLQLSEEDFDQKGDIDFVESYSAEEQVRGFFPYYQPAGCIRYGLNIKKYTEYDKNSSNWLSMNGAPDEWAVMFHGVRSPSQQVYNSRFNTNVSITKSIVAEGLRPGHNNEYQKDHSIVTSNHLKAFAYYDQQKKSTPIGKGIYGSPLIEITLDYACEFSIENELYLLIFQNRVRPDKINIASGQNDYWVVCESNFIRPYGILITKKSVIYQEKYQEEMSKFRTSYNEWIAQNSLN